MRFYEFNEPYYALVKSEDKSHAIMEYEKTVGNLEDDEAKLAKEVTRDYALASFSRVLSEDGNIIPVAEIVSDFQREESMTLIVDASLT
ncbi:hypothetical protein WKH56_19635 [Priestia sp. SB1]|uniref:hypothetical protein n=1 Tax=Priestia sp. SB1 TaxID=3132359 RepID=UPI00317C4F5A